MRVAHSPEQTPGISFAPTRNTLIAFFVCLCRRSNIFLDGLHAAIRSTVCTASGATRRSILAPLTYAGWNTTEISLTSMSMRSRVTPTLVGDLHDLKLHAVPAPCCWGDERAVLGIVQLRLAVEPSE